MTGHLAGNLEASSQIGILLATYCEVQNIKRLITEIESIQPSAQILVIDDSSPDGTATVVRNLQKSIKIFCCLLGLANLGWDSNYGWL